MNRESWPYWWATWETGQVGFVYGVGEQSAQEEAEKRGPVRVLKTLPYPPEPAPDGCPGLCYSPGRCAGNTACPKDYACSE